MNFEDVHKAKLIKVENVRKDSEMLTTNQF